MTLIQLFAHAWAFRDAELVVRVGGHTVHQTREIAVLRAREAGLVVDTQGHVTPLQRAAGGLS